MGNAQSEQKDVLQYGQIVKFDVFKEEKVRGCLKSLINFKNEKSKLDEYKKNMNK